MSANFRVSGRRNADLARAVERQRRRHLAARIARGVRAANRLWFPRRY